ncbi:MAG: DHA2 family efflux MFS transporter permease subunit [Solirubrobacterales bacterium]
MNSVSGSAAAAPAAPPELEKLFDRRLIQVSSVVILGIIMSILDTTIVNVALDTLARDFDTTLTNIQWVATGYLLALATVIPLTGWAAHRFGTKRLFIISITLFTIGSMLCGLAWNDASLIFFRVLQGFGGGMIMPVGMTILTQEAGPAKVGRMMGVIGVPMLLAPILGPILGGWLVDDVSWRWIFYVNVPIGILAVALAQRFLDRDEPSPGESLDWKGLLLLSPGMAAMVYGLAETGPEGGFSSPKVLVPLLVGAAMVIGFIFHALRAEDALIDVRLFKDKVMAVATSTSFILAMSFFGAMILMPLYFQVVRDLSALQAGLLVAPQGLGAAIMMPVAGKVTDRYGSGRIVPFGAIVLLACTYSLTTLGADTPYWHIIVTLFVMGLGMGATMMPTMSSAFITLKRDQVPRATSAINAIQRVGGSIGVAILSTYLTHAMTSNLSATAASAAESRGGIGALGELPPAAHDKIAPLIADAFGKTYWVSFGLLTIMFVLSLFLPRHGTAALVARSGSAEEDEILASEPPEAIALEV